MTSAPVLCNSFTVESSVSLLTSASTTFMPCLASSVPVAWPMPRGLPPPVMTATLPFKSFMNPPINVARPANGSSRTTHPSRRTLCGSRVRWPRVTGLGRADEHGRKGGFVVGTDAAKVRAVPRHPRPAVRAVDDDAEHDEDDSGAVAIGGGDR